MSGKKLSAAAIKRQRDDDSIDYVREEPVCKRQHVKLCQCGCDNKQTRESEHIHLNNTTNDQIMDYCRKVQENLRQTKNICHGETSSRLVADKEKMKTVLGLNLTTTLNYLISKCNGIDNNEFASFIFPAHSIPTDRCEELIPKIQEYRKALENGMSCMTTYSILLEQYQEDQKVKKMPLVDDQKSETGLDEEKRIVEFEKKVQAVMSGCNCNYTTATSALDWAKGDVTKATEEIFKRKLDSAIGKTMYSQMT